MHIKKATGYVLSRAEEENPVSISQFALSICNLAHDSFKDARLNSEKIRSPTVETIKTSEKIEPILQNEIKETVGVPDTNVQNFYNYLMLKSMESSGYSNFLYISEMLLTTCDDCKEAHGNLFCVKDFEEGIASIPQHPNCKCSLIGLDKEGEQAYYQDKDNFLEWIL